jgi:hypothetical protein
MGIKAKRGKPFTDTSIRIILTNERYTGNTLFQKVYTENHITHKKKRNEGELPQYFAEDTHPAIISMEVYNEVQADIKRRRELGRRGRMNVQVTSFTCMIQCGYCGANYNRSGRNAETNKKEYHTWTCNTKSHKGVAVCHAKNVPEKVLKEVSAKVLHIEAFDENVFQSKIEKIIVIGNDELLFRFRDGSEVTEKWKSTAYKDRWTHERKEHHSKVMKEKWRIRRNG